MTKVIKTSPEELIKAGEVIKNGGLVVFPTETVYGLGADGLSSKAVKSIFRAKGRPSDNPLILHVSDMKMAEKIGKITETARMIMEKFWPGCKGADRGGRSTGCGAKCKFIRQTKSNGVQTCF